MKTSNDIFHKRHDSHGISIMLKTGSVAGLSYDIGDIYKTHLKEDYRIDIISTPLLFFNRLKAKVEGQGDGTKIMTALVEILDEKGLAVFNTLNPYGKMKMKDLTRFYKKFGFIELDHGVMFRKPETTN